MTTILLFFVAILIFVIGIVSPHTANKIRRKTNKKATWLERMTNWFWDPITWWTKGSVEFTRKVIVKITKWSKQVRSKLPF